MRRNHMTESLVLVLEMVLMSLVLSSCGSGRAEAEQALAAYLTHIQNGQVAQAYQLVSDYDKKTLSEADFTAWRQSVADVVEKKSFHIKRQADRFKNYEYMGTPFGDAYGFEAGWEQERLVSGAQMTDYDEDTFLIMMVEENGSYKVLLLLADVRERTGVYRRQRDRGGS